MMGIKKVESQQLLDSAGYLFRTKGYNATTMEHIATLSAGINKASMYYHFKGKKELAIASFQDLHRVFEERFFAPLRDASVPAEQRITNYLEDVENFFIGREGGCLMANMALEVAHNIPEFTAVIQNYFQAWIDALAQALTPLLPAGKAHDCATTCVGQLQGAILLSNLLKDDQPLRHHRQHILMWLEK